MVEHDWKGHVLRIELRPLAISAWLFAALAVTVNGRRFGPNIFEKPVGRTTRTDFSIADGDVVRSGSVRSLEPMRFLPRIRYALTIDGAEIAQGLLWVEGWWRTLAAALVLGVVLGLAVFGLAILVMVSMQADPLPSPGGAE